MGILQARILEWVVCPFGRGSSSPRDWTRVSYLHKQAGCLPIVPPGNPPWQCVKCMWNKYICISSVQYLSLVRLCDPMDCSTPGFPVHHQLLELPQTHVHWVSNAIQPYSPLSSPSPPTFNLTQHQDLFQRVISSHQVASVLELQLHHQSFQWIFRTDFLYDWHLLAVQETLKSLLQYHSSKVPQFGTQLSL